MPLQSRPYAPSPEKCCNRCVFGRGPHAPWCESDHIAKGLDLSEKLNREIKRDFHGAFSRSQITRRRARA